MAEIFKTPENPTPEQPTEKTAATPEPQAEVLRNAIYKTLASPPQNALDTIKGGNLKGKTDINPQWRIEVITKQFGLCGIGWKFDIVETHEKCLPDGQILLFMKIAFYYKLDGHWSEPISAYGGDFIVEKTKNGLTPNDDAYKMCLTDALGGALKCIGVAADVYRGLYDTKYNRYADAPQQSNQNQPQYAQQQSAPQQAPQPEPEPWARFVNGRPQVRGKKGWQDLATLSPAELQAVMNYPYYALVHQAANNLLMTGTL